MRRKAEKSTFACTRVYVGKKIYKQIKEVKTMDTGTEDARICTLTMLVQAK